MGEPIVVKTILEFNCDSCPETITVETGIDVEPNSSWPKGWLFLRTHVIGLADDDEKMYCSVCREPLLTAMGYSSYKEYENVVKATAEAVSRNSEMSVEDIINQFGGSVVYMSDEEDVDGSEWN